MIETARRKLEEMPFDKRFGDCMGAGGELCHATGYEVCLGDVNNPADWWNEYERADGTLEYGR